jgi:hypothetical protein
VQNDQSADSGARVQPLEGDGLSEMTPGTAEYRGKVLKRYVRAAAALHGIYDDVALADLMDLPRGTVNGWWKGAQPKPVNLPKLARATGYDLDELTRFILYAGPAPHLPDPVAAAAEVRAEAARRAIRVRGGGGGSEGRPAPRGSAGSGR